MIYIILHRVLIKQDKLEDHDPTIARMRSMGLINVDNDDKKRAQAGVDKGVVVAIGETAFKDFGTASPIKVGDHIAYARFAGKFITDPVSNEEFVALNDEDIICVFKE